MAKVIVLILTSDKYRSTRRCIIENTWLKNGLEWPFYFYYGNSDRNTFKSGNEIHITIKESYKTVPQKVHCVIRFCLEKLDFTHLFLVDDDTYVVKHNLYSCGFEYYDMMGHYGGPPTQQLKLL